MATHGRGATGSVAEKLLNHAWEFEFFQAVRLLMRVLPAREPVGRSAKPQQEVVRFSSHVSLEFPASAIHDITHEDSDAPPRMATAFLGLGGVNGVLPIHYTEWMVLRQGAKDTAMAAFFDLFNHRWISLFYRAWEKHRLPVVYERTQLERAGSHQLCENLFALVGLASGYLRGRHQFCDDALLFYAGLVAQRPRSASALRGVLRSYFGIPVVVEQLLGTWYDLEPEDRSYLATEGIHNQLGVGAVAGDAVWDQQGRFRIRLGPLTYSRFCAFAPGARASRELTELVRFLVGRALAFEVQLILAAGEEPPVKLDDQPPRLGWDSWLMEGSLRKDSDDAVFADAA